MKLEKCCMCGIAPVIESEDSHVRIMCLRCGLKTSDNILVDMAAKEWNNMMKQSKEIVQKQVERSMPGILKERIYAAEEIIARDNIREERRKKREAKMKKELAEKEIPVVKGEEITGKQEEAERVETMEEPETPVEKPKRGRKAVKNGK